MPTDAQTLTARWVFPVAGPPLERGLVTVAGDRIAAVEPRGARTPDLDLGNAAILPGLVNAHTHLDLSGARGQIPPSPDFTGWLRRVIAFRRQRTPEQVRDDIRAGLAECLRAGTTLVGDISGDGASWDDVAAAPVWAVVFREVLGLSDERAARVWRVMAAWQNQSSPGQTCRPGLSPHAPYSVNVALIRTAATTVLPLAIHLAESREELELLDHHRGPFVDFLKELGVWEPAGLAKGVEKVLSIAQRPQPVAFAHGNFLPPDAAIPPNSTIVYCPRTHAAFGHPPHPFRDFLARGVRVALGTDSLASNPDLDLLAEARFLHARYPDMGGAALLRMATLSGAEALGFAGVTGSLEPGKSADLAVLPLPDEDAADPHALVFAPGRAVARVMWRGGWREGRGGS